MLFSNDLRIKEFMGKNVIPLSSDLYKVVDGVICSIEDIEQFDDYTIGVLYEPLDKNSIKVLYFKVGYPNRQTICDDIDNGYIPEKGLIYTENHAKELDTVIGGIM